MVRRVTPSQLNSMVRKAQQKQRQAIDKFNREVRGYNQKAKRVVDNYNREVRTHNARVRADRQRLKNELIRLNRQPVTARLMTFRTSVSAVQTAHKRLEHAADVSRFDARYNEILDLSERETANSAGLMNALLGDAEPPDELLPNAPDSLLIPVLHAISADLSDRWRGALFSLNLSNPDAARHFCTSAREIITRILDTKAPDSIVTGAMPGCDCTPRENRLAAPRYATSFTRKEWNRTSLKPSSRPTWTMWLTYFRCSTKALTVLPETSVLPSFRRSASASKTPSCSFPV